MINVLSVEMLSDLINKHTLEKYLIDLMHMIRQDFARVDQFEQGNHSLLDLSLGQSRLMSAADSHYLACKYLSHYPNNPSNFEKQSVVATGQLSSVSDGYPLLITEMTLLNALASAGISALSSDLLAVKHAKTIAVIGLGAQSEFQVLAHRLVRSVRYVRYYDPDAGSMIRFYSHLKNQPFKLIACENALKAINGADIVIVCSSKSNKSGLPDFDWLRPDQHVIFSDINALVTVGAAKNLLENIKFVVECISQISMNIDQSDLSKFVSQTGCVQLSQLLLQHCQEQDHRQQTTMFNCTGSAIADFSTLKLTYQLCETYQIAQVCNMVPPLDNPENLYSVLKSSACMSGSDLFNANR